MEYSMKIVFEFEFEHILEKNTFIDQCYDYTQCTIEEINDLRIKVFCEDWEVAEVLEEFVKKLPFDIIEWSNYAH